MLARSVSIPSSNQLFPLLGLPVPLSPLLGLSHQVFTHLNERWENLADCGWSKLPRNGYLGVELCVFLLLGKCVKDLGCKLGH